MEHEKSAHLASCRASRGHLVLEALRSGSVQGIRELLARIDPADYLPCNLAYGDGEQLEVAYLRGTEPAIERVTLGPGLHVLANDRLGSPEFPKAERLAERARPHLGRPWPELRATLAELLADHTLPELERIPPPPPGSPFSRELLVQLQALCIHTPAYGTRSATLAAIVPGELPDYHTAEGPPCQTRFISHRHLLEPRPVRP
jgi:uncharacterized protein with NRDE domain